MNQLSAQRPDRHRTIGALVMSGVAPIVALTVAVLVDGGGAGSSAARALIAYGAVVVGFLGGMRWGAELIRAPGAPHPGRLACAAAATMLGWAALLLEPAAALVLLIASAGAQLAWDLRAAQTGHLPAWTARLRIATSGLAAACLALTLLTFST